MSKREHLNIAPHSFPRILLLGNGMLRLGGGGDWKKLLQSIAIKNFEHLKTEGIPYAMLPEVVCGTNVEEVRCKIAEEIQDSRAHELLQELLKLNFDAIITTNYTYEIEQMLSNGKWSEKQRKESFFALDGNSHTHFSTYVCNLIQCDKTKVIPVFHVHGEKARKSSLILSYYSYARSVSKLIEYNAKRANQYQEQQQGGEPIEVHSWLDYFLLGDVYAVGFGFDPSEFDVWWAIERKSREKAEHGRLHAYILEKTGKSAPQKALLEAMDAEYIRIDVDGDYEPAYRQAVDEIRDQLG